MNSNDLISIIARVFEQPNPTEYMVGEEPYKPEDIGSEIARRSAENAPAGKAKVVIGESDLNAMRYNDFYDDAEKMLYQRGQTPPTREQLQSIFDPYKNTQQPQTMPEEDAPVFADAGTSRAGQNNIMPNLLSRGLGALTNMLVPQMQAQPQKPKDLYQEAYDKGLGVEAVHGGYAAPVTYLPRVAMDEGGAAYLKPQMELEQRITQNALIEAVNAGNLPLFMMGLEQRYSPQATKYLSDTEQAYRMMEPGYKMYMTMMAMLAGGIGGAKMGDTALTPPPVGLDIANTNYKSKQEQIAAQDRRSAAQLKVKQSAEEGRQGMAENRELAKQKQSGIKELGYMIGDVQAKYSAEHGGKTNIPDDYLTPYVIGNRKLTYGELLALHSKLVFGNLGIEEQPESEEEY